MWMASVTVGPYIRLYTFYKRRCDVSWPAFMMLPMTKPQSSAAWRELLSAFADFENLFLEGPKAVRGELAVAEGYRFLATMLGLSLDVTLFADPVAPRRRCRRSRGAS